MHRLVSHAVVCACFLPTILFAQAPSPPITLAPVEVTGTRLRRPLAESPISYTLIPREALEQAGRNRIGEILRELPEFPSNPITDVVAFNSARGVMAVDLRGLGSGNTLVLVNGRRTTVNASAFDVTTTYVDMNRFSPAFIERVEILKGGASAVYGADAVGGVINFITRRRPAGGEASISYGNTFKNDAAEVVASVATGVSRGRLGLGVGLEYFHRNAQAHRDRSFTRTANLVPRFASAYDFYAALPPAVLAGYDGRSLNSANAVFTLVPNQINGQNGVSVPGLAAGAPITALPGAGRLTSATPNFTAPFHGPTGGAFHAAAAATFVAPELTRGDPGARNLYNFNSVWWTVPAAERTSATARADYETASGIAVFAEATGGRNRSRTVYHSRDFSSVVPRTNAYNPFGVDVTVGWRIPDGGPRRSLTEDDTSAGQIGVRSAPRSAITWEAAATYSRDEFIDTTDGLYAASRVRAALASANPATALNPFGGAQYRHSPALVDSLSAQAWLGGRADLLVFDAQASGDLIRLPSGVVRAAGLVEQRRERFSRLSDPLSRSGDILGTGQSGANGDFRRTVRAVAAEVHAPLLGGAPGQAGRPRLAIEAAARIEDFSGSFRSGARPSVGLVARLTDDLQLRANEARTFRAPTLPQLYSPQGDTFFNSILDPRRPAALTGDPFDGANVSRLVRQGGNPGLHPETGRVRQIGATWEVRPLGGLVLDAAWFRYELSDLISGASPNYILAQELGGLGYLVHREAGSQSATNRTAAPIAVLTGPAGQTTLVAPGQSITVPGRLARLDIFTVNLSRRQLQGWDFGARHTFAIRGGRVGATATVTYTDQASSAYDAQAPLVASAGSTSNPRWRGRASLDWTRGAWSAGTTMAYTASSGYHTATGGYQKPYRVVHLRASYTAGRETWLRGLTFSAGIDDVFNETPPLFPDPPIGFNYGAVPRPQGRFGRLMVKKVW